MMERLSVLMHVFSLSRVPTDQCKPPISRAARDWSILCVALVSILLILILLASYMYVVIERESFVRPASQTAIGPSAGELVRALTPYRERAIEFRMLEAQPLIIADPAKAK